MSTKEKDVIARLADRGETALHRLTELPGGTKMLHAFNGLKERVDELSKKMRGVDALEKRVAKLEKQVAAMQRASKPKPAAKPSPTRKPAA